MKNFSIFEEALKFSDTSQLENLGQLSNISRRDFDERESFVLRTTAPCLEYASLMIENALLLNTNRKGRVYVGFERLSCMEPIVGRYMRIADVSESVSIFGEPDWKPPSHPNIRLVRLGADFRLARERFLIAYSSTLQVALVGRDDEGFNAPTMDQRKFCLVKSSNPEVVANLASAAEALIDFSLAA